MTSPRQIYHNPVANVAIQELKTSFTFVCGADVDATYGPYFQQAQGNRSVSGDKVHWTFGKDNEYALQVMDQLTNTSVKSLFSAEVAEIAPPKVESIQDAMARMALNVPVQKPADDGGEYPRLIYSDLSGQHQIQIVDYSPAAMALFCPKEYGQTYKDTIVGYGGKFNMSLKCSTDGTSKMPGWVFSKSKPATREFLKAIANGQDVVALATAPVSKWGDKKSAVLVASNGPVSFGAPAMVSVTIPGIPSRAPNPSSVVSGSFAPPPAYLQTQRPVSPPKHNLTPGVALTALLNALTMPMAIVFEEQMSDPTGAIRVCFHGPISEVDAKVSEFEKETSGMGAFFSKETEFVHNGNKAVAVVRVLPSDDE